VSACWLRHPLAQLPLRTPGSAPSTGSDGPLDKKPWPILHSVKDRMNAIKLDDYFDTYKLIGVYLAYLDISLDKPE
jgi:hypothetical protein